MFPRSHRQIFWSLALTVTLATPVSADESLEAANRLSEGAQKLAERFFQFASMEQRGTEVVLGDFTAPPRLRATGGPAVRRVLEAALKNANVAVKETAPWQLTGTFTAQTEEEESVRRLVLRLTAKVLDSDDREAQSFSISVRGDDVLQITGVTVDLAPPKTGEAIRQEQAIEAIATPQAEVIGTESRATKDCLFGMEILVPNGGQREPRRPAVKNGRSFVKLDLDEEYVVRLHNRADFEAAATLTIDGLNMFTFSQLGNGEGQLLVPPHSSIDVRGWFINLGEVRAFEIATLGESEAAKLGAIGDIGTITAKFAAAWTSDRDRPADELRTKAGDLGTRLGQPLAEAFKEEQRFTGRARAFISVRYER